MNKNSISTFILMLWLAIFSTSSLLADTTTLSIANEAGKTVEVTLQSDTTAPAYIILANVLGTVGESLVCQSSNCSTLPGQIFRVFNSGLLIFATLTMSYMILMTSFSEGGQNSGMLERKYASPWIAARSILGISFLVPTSSGYSVLQMIVIKVILLGSSLGDFIWRDLIAYQEATNSSISREASIYNTNQNANTQVTYIEAKTIAGDLLEMSLCNSIMNNPDYQSNATGFTPTSQDQGQLFNFWDQTSDDGENIIIKAGLPYSSAYGTYCGTLTIESDYGFDVKNFLYQIASVSDQIDLNTLLVLGDQASQEQDTYNTIVESMAQQFISTAKTKDISQATTNSNIKNTSWIEIPFNFYNLLKITGSGKLIEAKPSYTSSLSSDYPTPTYSIHINSFITNMNTGFKTTEEQDSGSSWFSVSFKNSNGADKSFNSMIQDLFRDSDKVDPIIELSKIGKFCLTLAYNLLSTLFLLNLATAAILSVCSDNIPFSNLGILMSLASILVGIAQTSVFLIPIGTMLGILLPATPILIIVSAIFSWIMQSVATMASVPLVALALISPGEELGKATPALMLLANIFLRPALTVVGFIAGAKLFNMSFVFLTGSLINTVAQFLEAAHIKHTDPGILTIFGMVFFFAYSSMMMVLCSRSYSLTYALPSAVLSWIGAQALPASEGQIVGAAHQAVKQGVDVAQGVARSSIRVDHSMISAKDQTDRLINAGNRLVGFQTAQDLSKKAKRVLTGAGAAGKIVVSTGLTGARGAGAIMLSTGKEVLTGVRAGAIMLSKGRAGVRDARAIIVSGAINILRGSRDFFSKSLW